MGCLRSMAKYLIFLFNLVFVLVGLAFLIIGVIFKLELDKEVFKNNDKVADFALAPIFLIVLGCIVFLIAFLGCCGAIKKSTCMLTTYAIILFIILALQLAVGIFAFVQINNNVDLKNEIFRAIKDDMKNYNSNEAVKEYFDSIQKQLKCCGVEGPNDWKSYGNLSQLPKSCCVTDSCSQTFQQGCGTLIYDALADNVKIVGIVAIVICAVELIAGILALCVGHGHKRGHYA